MECWDSRGLQADWAERPNVCQTGGSWEINVGFPESCAVLFKFWQWPFSSILHFIPVLGPCIFCPSHLKISSTLSHPMRKPWDSSWSLVCIDPPWGLVKTNCHASPLNSQGELNSNSEGQRWSPIICGSNTFPGNVAAASLGTTVWKPL